ncbi:MAG: 4Fe-4S binding protein [Candidatus Schekmanbacteria bacterium]|nr:4Fe-4S binding protein [Candidatus Schekmanbacteria bacterium]
MSVPSTVGVLSCEHVPAAASLGLGLAEPRGAVVPGLCCDPSRLVGRVPAGMDRLLLGLCSTPVDNQLMQEEGRRAGIEPLCVDVVVLPRSGAGSQAVAARRARLLVAGALARLGAFEPPGPDGYRFALPRTLSRRSILRLRPAHLEPVPVVAHERCAAGRGCKRCLEACQQHAIAPGRTAVAIAPQECTGCGQCVAACPVGALFLPGSTTRQILTQVRALARLASSELPTWEVAYRCRGGGPSETGALPVEVHCVSLLSPALLLLPLALGAARVSVAMGGEGHEHERGTAERLGGRVELGRRVLAALDANPARLELSSRAHEELPDDDSGAAAYDDAWLADEAAGDGGRLTAAVIRQLVRRFAGGEARLDVADPFSPFGALDVNADACALCGVCALACPTSALHCERTGGRQRLLFTPSRCVACGLCAARCPERAAGALVLERRLTDAILDDRTETLVEVESAACARCGKAVESGRLQQLVGARLARAEHATPAVRAALCDACRAPAFAL